MASGAGSLLDWTSFTQEENQSDKNVPVARIPWIPMQTGDSLQPGVLDLEKSNYFKEMVANKTNLQLFQLMNQVFPFYLPKRYHTMDGWSLHKSSKDGQYWANASHFLMANQAHEQIYFYNLFEELKKSSPDLSKFDPIFPPKSRELLLKDGVEQCTSAAEFLLEPWILIQLPFQPILMQQWAVALMAEALKFQKEICDFYIMSFYPQRFQIPLKQLNIMCDKMLTSASTMLNLVFSYFTTGHYNIQCVVVPCLNFLSTCMSNLMPILEFVLSDECRNIIKALKRMCWKSATTRGEKLGECIYRCMDMATLSSMYNYEFWKSKTAVKASSVGPPSHRQQKDIEKSLNDEYFLNHKNKDMQRSDWDTITKLIDDLIKLGRLKQEDREKFLNAVHLDPEDSKYLCFVYNNFAETSSATKVVDDANAGVLDNLISLYSDVRLTEILATLSASLVGQVFPSTYPNRKLYANAPGDCEGPSFDVRYIQKKLSKVQEPNNKWKYQNILARVKETCFSSLRTKEPNFKHGAKKVAEHFQERIKNLVFKMIETQSKTINGPFTYYPECQVVQYLLPCFVASYLDLDNDPSASTKEKEDYLSFVHEIVKSYEDKEFCQKLPLAHRKLPFTSGIQRSFLAKKVQHWQQNVISSLAKISTNKVISKFQEKGLGVLGNCSHHLMLRCLTFKDFNPWSLQLFMFLCRINSILDKMTALSDAPFQSFVFMLAISHCKLLNREGTRPNMYGTLLICRLVMIVEQVSPPFDLMIEEEKRQDPSFLAQSSDLEKITCVQLFGIVMFQYMASLETEFLKIVKNDCIEGPGFPLDSIDAVFWSILTQDRWKVMQQLCTFLDSELFRDSPYLASFAFATSNEFYSPVLQLISSEGKVKMSHPGEITFFPIKHCRWCGLVDAKEFRTCQECLEYPEYLDINFFCSVKCEEDCLKKQHTEEHARFLMIKCDIDI